MKAEDLFRWFGIDPAAAHHHELDMVTEEARREHAEYLEMLSGATLTIEVRSGEPVVARLVMSPITDGHEDEP